MAMADLRDGGRLKDIHAFIDGLYDHDLHAKRVDSLAAATLGVMTGASLAVAMIGQALAQARKRSVVATLRRAAHFGPDVVHGGGRCDGGPAVGHKGRSYE